MSCATCHNPMFGWSDALPKAKGYKSKVLKRSTPTIINRAFEILQSWSGSKRSLAEQALASIESNLEMNMDINDAIKLMQNNAQYQKLFNEAYPQKKINKKTLVKAIVEFERTIISVNSPFDRWIKGNKNAMTKQQINGFKLFVDTEKGNCETCHSAPNFTDNDFHNIGLGSYAESNPDLGRYTVKPFEIFKGAFKTPGLREIVHTAPYFHDGSAKSLKEVIRHYVHGGTVKSNLSPKMKPANLTQQEQLDIIAFLQAISTPAKEYTLPVLP